ncbi:MAG TPA: exodeoxyribonuclease VII large subunit [Bacteroidaceae bacterium]|nr:exodeoxyribonuclease VII large subunit [Bacteroidaceae bacterium]
MQVLSLFELNSLIKGALEYTLTDNYWVRAEISGLNVAYNGHCYLELVQKNENGSGLLTKSRATIWSGVFREIKPRFEKETGQRLSAGMNILVRVRVEFHELYGLSLNILDIDPTYTMGDMERRRREILLRLSSEGVIDLNKELIIPMVPNRVAVISSANAAGYGDFMDQLNSNSYNFFFETRLFQAVMQGEKAEESIIAALDSIALNYNWWDVVVIIRGGGATSELSCFDSYNLAVNIANFPIPIITGIGHERDDTVIDVVSNTRVKTPTAAAELLIGKMLKSANLLYEFSGRLKESMFNVMDREKRRIELLSQKIPSLFKVIKIGQEKRIDSMREAISRAVRARYSDGIYRCQSIEIYLNNIVKKIFLSEKHRIELLEKDIDAASPEIILKRGYTLTLKEGKVISSSLNLLTGDSITTLFADGKIESSVK